MAENENPFQKQVKLDLASDEDDWAALMKKLAADDAASELPRAEHPQPTKGNPPSGSSAGKEPAPLEIKFQEEEKKPVPSPVSSEDATHPATPASQIGEQGDRPMTRYEQLCKLPSMPMEQDDKKVMVEFSGVIAKVNEAGKAFSQLRHQFPELIPPHLQSALRENLRETSTVMLRELHNMRNGRQQKKYDNRYICKRCHSVFMIPLPSDRLCDECRASDTATAAPKPY